MFRVVILFVASVSLFGCGDDQVKTTQPSLEASIASPLQNECGVTKIDRDNGAFVYECGINESEVIDVAFVPLSNEQQCTVTFAGNGQPRKFYCQKEPESINSFVLKGATLYTDWSCTGLDGFGSFNNTKHKSQLTLRDDNTFSVYYNAKPKSDSVWFVADSVIDGYYEVDSGNTIQMNPLKWSSSVIDSAGLTIKDASEFMFVKPLLFDVSELNEQKLSGDARWLDKDKYGLRTGIHCTKMPLN